MCHRENVLTANHLSVSSSHMKRKQATGSTHSHARKPSERKAAPRDDRHVSGHPKHNNQHGRWLNLQNQREQLDIVAKKLNIKVQHDWYNYKTVDIRQAGAYYVSYYNNSVYKVLKTLYPGTLSHYYMQSITPSEFNWYPWLFSGISRNCFDKQHQRREFFDWFAYETDKTTQEDFYSTTLAQVTQVTKHSLFLTTYYQQSIYRALKDVYPEYIWYAWKFKHCTPGFWQEPSNQRAFLDWFAEENSFNGLDDWYSVQAEVLKQLGGASVLKYYDDSIIRMLQTLYPEHTWHQWRFSRISSGFWHNINNQRRYFDWLADKLGIETQAQWYELTRHDVFNTGGEGLLASWYSNSTNKALAAIYPEYTWNSWQFARAPLGFWEDTQNLMQFLNWAGEKLNVTCLEDWYTVSCKQLIQLGGSTPFGDGHLVDSLVKCFPDYDWNFDLFNSDTKAQAHLSRILHELFDCRVAAAANDAPVTT